MLEGKIVKTSFKTKDIVSTSRPLELLHIDLFGPINTAFIYGSKYGLNFLELKMMHMMCLVTSALKYSLKTN